MIEGLTGEKQIQAMMEVLGVDRLTAEFIMAIEEGRLDGDIELDADTDEPKDNEGND